MRNAGKPGQGRLPPQGSVGDWAFTALAYTSRWRSTDQIPLRSVKDGRLSRLAAVEDTDGGRTHRFIASLSRNAEGPPQIALYVQKRTF